MILFFDTSALIKRYIDEAGSGRVDELFEHASQIIVSPITKIESLSAIGRLYDEKVISPVERRRLKEMINLEFSFITVLPLSDEIETFALQNIEMHQLKSLDSIQLASCMLVRDSIQHFVVADLRLIEAARKERIPVINPLQSK